MDQELLRVRDGHRDIRFSRSRCDRAILIDAEIEVPQPDADLVRGATAAENRPSEIILEDIARPVSRKHPAREDMSAVTDQPSHISSVVAGETGIEPFDPLFGDG